MFDDVMDESLFAFAEPVFLDELLRWIRVVAPRGQKAGGGDRKCRRGRK